MLDWHSSLTAVMAAWGAEHGIQHDWRVLANERRRRSLRRMANTIDAAFNIGDVHRGVCDELFDENLPGGSPEERAVISGQWHQLDAGRISPRRCAGCGGAASVSRSGSSVRC